MDVDARIEALQLENDRLRDRIAFLEAAHGLDFVPPIEWRLTGSEARVLGCLLKRETASKAALMSALYRDDGRDEPEIKIVDVFICKVRKKLKGLGIEIVTIWGQGYALTPASKVALRQAIADPFTKACDYRDSYGNCTTCDAEQGERCRRGLQGQPERRAA